MPEITTPRELFIHELADILYVERKLADETLPMLIGEVEDDDLRRGLESHRDQTRRHVSNVEKVFGQLGEDARTEACVGFEGLVSEHDKLKSETASELTDLVDLGAAARTEAYEIAAYESLRRLAKAIGEDDAVGLLDENLRDEKEALRQIEVLATRLTKQHAAASARG